MFIKMSLYKFQDTSKWSLSKYSPLDTINLSHLRFRCWKHPWNSSSLKLELSHGLYLQLLYSDTKAFLDSRTWENTFFALYNVVLLTFQVFQIVKYSLSENGLYCRERKRDSWREVRERKEAEQHNSAICRQFFDAISSVQLLAANDWHVFFSIKPL